MMLRGDRPHSLIDLTACLLAEVLPQDLPGTVQ
jgi:hypothetical protein